MIALWMLYAAFLGLVLWTLGRVIEELVRLGDRPRRWIWVGAMTLTLAIPTALYLAPSLGATGWAVLDLSELTVGAAGTPNPVGGRAIEPAAMRTLTGQRVWPIPAWYGKAALVAWLLLSGGLGARLLLAVGRLRGRREEWQRATLDGTPLLVSASTGPAVIGLRRPEIVVPAWAVELDDEALGLLIEHERQHLVARDAWLAGVAEVLLVLVPWNPGLWLQRRRLRRAIELDCDRRVLARGASRIRYGRVLLDVGERLAGWRAPAMVAFAERRTELAERIEALVDRLPRATRKRAAAATGAAALLVAVACLSPRPLPLATERDSAAGPPAPMAITSAPAPASPALLVLEGLRRLGADTGAAKIDRLVIVRDRENRIVEVFGTGPGRPTDLRTALAHLAPDGIETVEVTKGQLLDGVDLVLITLKVAVPDSAAWRRGLATQPASTDIVLRVLGSRRVTLNDQPVAFDDLERTLHAVYDHRPTKVLYIRADPTVGDRQVAEVVAVARRADVRVATPFRSRP